MEPKQKQQPVMDETGDRSKVWCCKDQYCTGTWNVRSMNQGKLEVVKQQMARVNIDILGISELNSPIPVHLVRWFLECRRSLLPSLVWPLPICIDSWTWHSRFLCNIALYSIGPCFYHQSHPHLGVVFAFFPSLHSFWSCFSTDLQ